MTAPLHSSEDKKPSFSRISGEFDGIRHYNADGNEIIPNPLEQNVGVYRPSYDIEAGTGNGLLKNEFRVYFDVHTEIAHFKSYTYLLGWLKAIRKCLLHKYIWRHFR